MPKTTLSQPQPPDSDSDSPMQPVRSSNKPTHTLANQSDNPPQVPPQILEGKGIESDSNSGGFTGIQGRDDKGGVTTLGKVIGVIKTGQGFRVLTNRGWRGNFTSPYFEHRPGGDFGRKSAEKWVDEYPVRRSLPEEFSPGKCNFLGICARDGEPSMRLVYYIIQYEDKIYALTRTDIKTQLGGVSMIPGGLEQERNRMRDVLNKIQKTHTCPETNKRFSKIEFDGMPWLKNVLSPLPPQGPVEPMTPIKTRFMGSVDGESDTSEDSDSASPFDIGEAGLSPSSTRRKPQRINTGPKEATALQTGQNEREELKKLINKNRNLENENRKLREALAFHINMQTQEQTPPLEDGEDAESIL